MASFAFGIAALQQRLHVGGETGHAFDPALVIEQMLQLFAAHAVAQQMQQRAGIDRARPRAHHQAVERREAHGGRDALAVADRRHAGAVAEMRDDQAAWNAAGDGGQGMQDRFVGQAVEAVAPQAGLPDISPAAGSAWRSPAGVAWKAVSKQATWGRAGQQRLQRLDRRDIVRLVQRRQRDQRASSVRIVARRCAPVSEKRVPPCTTRWPAPSQSCRAARRSPAGRSAASDASAWCRQRAALAPIQRGCRAASATDSLSSPWPMPASCPRSSSARLAARRRGERRELQARRAGIEDQDALGHEAAADFPK